MNTTELKTAAHAAWEEGDLPAAEQHFLAALAIDEQDAQTHYDLALLYKNSEPSNWPLAQRHNARALEIKPDDEAAWWNLGIAATANRDWATAASAWAKFDQTFSAEQLDALSSATSGERVAIRIRVGKQQEVIWGQRLDPARARVSGVPLPDLEIGHGDILLLDGVPRGAREFDGVSYPVYEVLERWHTDTYATYVIEAEVHDEAAQDTLFKAAADLGLVIADFDFNVASEAPKWLVVRQYGVAAMEDQPVADLIAAWLKARGDVVIRDVYVAYPEE
ncbi:hypothetical protein HQ393_09345 [Chitinibacter bivalviorum]|uniref:Uncharacterized protein n=1 Tax=Chitinibacter bivalviorum TaxID=2739434 RepID=A0A7H9BIH1_9NEIS|nr:hypothetical protein [Chitinibacter bivalviorum]QLG88435.1 hypothetical protein HQ393_09345 [Chitinibacter bivalviorum]